MLGKKYHAGKGIQDTEKKIKEMEPDLTISMSDKSQLVSYLWLTSTLTCLYFNGGSMKTKPASASP